MNFIKNNFKYILVINVMFLVIIIIAVNRNLPTPDEINKAAFEQIKQAKFEGLVINKLMVEKP